MRACLACSKSWVASHSITKRNERGQRHLLNQLVTQFILQTQCQTCDGCYGNKKPPVKMLPCLTVWRLCTAERNSRKEDAKTLSDPHWKTYHVQTHLCPVCRGWPPEEPKGKGGMPSQSCPFPSPSFQHLAQAHILTTAMLAAGPRFLPLPSSTFWAWIQEVSGAHS